VLAGPVTPAQHRGAARSRSRSTGRRSRASRPAAGGVLRILQTTPIDPAALDAKPALLATARSIPDPPAADIAALATFLPLAAPTAAQTAAATKALIAPGELRRRRAAQRATINVLADTIRFMLQR